MPQAGRHLDRSEGLETSRLPESRSIHAGPLTQHPQDPSRKDHKSLEWQMRTTEYPEYTEIQKNEKMALFARRLGPLEFIIYSFPVNPVVLASVFRTSQLRRCLGLSLAHSRLATTGGRGLAFSP